MPDDYSIGWHRGKRAIIYYRAGKRYRHSLGTTDKREAERRAPAKYAELTRPTGKTVVELWDAFVADRQGRAVIGTMRYTWKALADRFALMNAETITVHDCRAHIQERRAAGIKDGTLLTELGHLRTVLNWSVKHGLLDKAPYIERPAAPKPNEKFLTHAEVMRLYAAGTMPHVKLYVLLLYTTAARTSALLDLTWDRVDFERGRIDLEDPDMTRPHKGRAVVRMNRTARDALAKAREGALSRYVIEWAGKKVGSAKRGLAEAGRRAGLGKVTPHMLRHSAAVRMIESGQSMEQVAQMLGHSNMRTTRNVYARFSPDHLKEAAAVLEFDTGTDEPVSPDGKNRLQAENVVGSVDWMVGATGIEPVTPTMSRKKRA